jgi:hypothetical protein
MRFSQRENASPDIAQRQVLYCDSGANLMMVAMRYASQ